MGYRRSGFTDKPLVSRQQMRVRRFGLPGLSVSRTIECMGQCMSHLVIIRRITVAGRDPSGYTPRIKLGRGRNCHVRCACVCRLWCVMVGATKASQAKNCPRRLTRSHPANLVGQRSRAPLSLSTTSLNFAQQPSNPQALRLPGSLHHPPRSSKALSMLWTERTSDE